MRQVGNGLILSWVCLHSSTLVPEVGGAAQLLLWLSHQPSAKSKSGQGEAPSCCSLLSLSPQWQARKPVG